MPSGIVRYFEIDSYGMKSGRPLVIRRGQPNPEGQPGASMKSSARQMRL